jgi:putative membrane protein
MFKAKHFDPQAFLESLCCLAFSSAIIYLVASGKYLDYVTPRMKPYLIFAAAMMLAWCASGVFGMFRARRRARSSHCLVMAVPIILLFLPKTAVSATEISNKYVPQASKPVSSIPAATVAPADGLDEFDIEDYQDSYVNDLQKEQLEAVNPVEDYQEDLPGLDAKAKTITVGDDEFYLWLNEIANNLDKYAGYRVSVTGFVLKDPEVFAENEFVPARLGMSCCVADLVPYGILCKYDNATDLVEEDWVTVEGVIQAGEYMGFAEAQVLVDKISPAEEVEGYLYPY